MKVLTFIFCLIVSNQLISQIKQDTRDPIAQAPYHGYFKGFKNADSLTLQQISELGPLLCSNSQLEVIEFTLTVWGTCLGGIGIQKEVVIANNLTEKSLKLIRLLQPGSFIGFEDIKVRNKTGGIYGIRLFHYKIKD